MPSDIDPDLLAKWSPYAFLLVWTVLAGGFASFITWTTTKGLDAYIRFSEYRKKAKTDKLQQEQAEHQPFTLDSIYEDRGLALGFKAVLKMQDGRIREMEDKDVRRTKEMQELHTAHLNCVQDHAESEIARFKLGTELKSLREKYDRLEAKLNRFASSGRTDPWPSPTPQEENKQGDQK